MKIASGILIIFLLIMGCRKTWTPMEEYDYRLPRVLFLTTGDGRGEGTVSDGAIVALQAFNRLGAYVRFENRTFLWDAANLNDYDIIIAPTLYGYHDADRMYSLTYMDDRELRTLRSWVKQGGVLVVGENFGRNRPDGVDRVTLGGRLWEPNWVLAPAVGLPLQEVDVKGFRLSAVNHLSHQYPNPLIMEVENSAYILLPADSAAADTTQFQVWFQWEDARSGKRYPAVFVHHYGKGHLVYFSASRILHPALDGGLSGTLQIEYLYRKMVELSVGKRRFPLALNPWPNAAQAVLAVTFDDGGTLEEYQRALTSLFPYVEKITLFLTGYVSEDILRWCQNQPQLDLQNHSWSHPRFRGLSYLETLRQIRLPEIRYQQRFRGFRFPYVINSFWGMHILAEQGYSYESSIVVDHTRFYGGGIFPYNIPIFHASGWFQSLDMLEISPLQHDDWYFYGKGVNEQENYPEFQQKRDAARYRSYLNNFWQEVIVPEQGIMTVLAHPLYSGKNQILLAPILELVREVHDRGQFWLPSLSDVAEYWHKRHRLIVDVAERGNTVTAHVHLPAGISIPGLTLKLPQSPRKVRINRGSGELHVVDDTAYYIFNATDGVEVRFEF
jgi:peptidoglycan/xylan/chitin deacetylase (PgdA/CDA1 family)